VNNLKPRISLNESITRQFDNHVMIFVETD